MAILAIIELDTRFHVQNQRNGKEATFVPATFLFSKFARSKLKRIEERMGERKEAGGERKEGKKGRKREEDRGKAE